MKAAVEREVEKILLENYEKYYKAAFSYVQNEHDALDIVQESAYKAIKECKKVKQREYISTWIYRIVINTALDFLRKTSKETELTEEILEKEGELDDNYIYFDIMDLLAKLEEKERIVIIMRYFEGYKLEQIAEITGEGLSTVKSRLYRTLKKLKLELEPLEAV